MSELLAFIAGIFLFVAAICFITALIDMGMNGSLYADWAPWGMGIAFILGAIALAIDPAPADEAPLPEPGPHILVLLNEELHPVDVRFYTDRRDCMDEMARQVRDISVQGLAVIEKAFCLDAARDELIIDSRH